MIDLPLKKNWAGRPRFIGFKSQVDIENISFSNFFILI